MSDYASNENRFTNFEPLGRGAYGCVYRALDSCTNEYIAMKKIRMNLESDGIPSAVLREVSILQKISHANIVNLLDVIPREDRIFLIFECLESDLRKLLESGQAIPSSSVASIIQQILKALYCCHSRRILHRDLKPENVLLSSTHNAKLADFGLARTLQMPNRPYTAEVQTLWYRAPEVLLGAERYGFPIDIWSAGCIFAELITGRPLFQGASALSQIIEICRVRGTPNEASWPGVSRLRNFSALSEVFSPTNLSLVVPGIDSTASDLLNKMLEMDPSKRITAKNALQHPFFDRLLN